MSQWSLAGLFLLTIFYTVAGVEEIRYEGLRVDMSARTLNRDIIECITPAMKKVTTKTFKPYHEHDIFSSLYIEGIKVTHPEIDERFFTMNKFKFSNSIYEVTTREGCVSFYFSFRYFMNFLGFRVASGTGTALIIHKAKKIYVFFNETHPDVQIPRPWDIINLNIAWGLFTPKAWIRTVLEKKFIPDFHKVVDDAMDDFADKLLKAYEHVEDISEDTDLVYHNVIIDVKATVGDSYISIGFDTKITVDDTFVRKMYRRQIESVTPLGDFRYCLAAEMFPDTLDTLSKAGYFKQQLSPKQWGFDNNTVSVLYGIIPRLHNYFLETESFNIICDISHNKPINEITYRGDEDKSLDMQYPMNCEFRGKHRDGEEKGILQLDIYARFKYEMKEIERSYVGHINSTELYGFETAPKLPIINKDILGTHVKKYIQMYENTKILAPGLRIIPNRVDYLKYVRAKITNFEICFDYDEVRP